MIRNIRNKKASIPVVVLVILTIAVCIGALVTFTITGNNISKEVLRYTFLDKVYDVHAGLNQGYGLSVYAEELGSIGTPAGVITVKKEDRKGNVIYFIRYNP